MHIAMTYTRLRAEERLLLDAFESAGVRVTPIDLRQVVFDPASLGEWAQYDAVVDRSVSLTASLTVTRILEGLGVRCINRPEAIRVCSDKLDTTIALIRAGVPTPGVRVGISAESAIESVEQIGYPAVLKPTVGSGMSRSDSSCACATPTSARTTRRSGLSSTARVATAARSRGSFWDVVGVRFAPGSDSACGRGPASAGEAGVSACSDVWAVVAGEVSVSPVDG